MAAVTLPQADPGLGVFETILVVAAEPVWLDAHLARMRGSLERLYGATLPSEAAELARERAAGYPLGRLRVDAVPANGGVRLSASAAAVPAALVFPPVGQGVELRSAPLPGGHGAHKWVDRSRLPVSEPGSLPLLLDEGGEVLEATRASVFAVCDGTLLTPRADGRILPGITRAAALEVARQEGLEVAERRLWLDDLLNAEECFATGSVRGVEAVAAIDGAAVARGEITRLIGSRLAERCGLTLAPAR
ncbi:MAG TPA: aminotransferase class IV [Solirubrobacterales bacterium]|nr:aminotransferase class IV [Solirubrobacterales bacterium]